MSENTGSEAEEKIEGSVIPIRWRSSEDLPTIYANQLLITHAGGEFYLIFGEFVPPLIDKGFLPENVYIKPVAKIAITPQNMAMFNEAFRQNLEMFKSKLEQLEKDE
jgi:hypothetical protein